MRLLTRHSLKEIPTWAQGLEVAQGDVARPDTLLPVLRDTNTIIHLAALNEVDSQRNPRLALEVNGGGTENLLAAAQAAGVRRFIYFSTFHVYGPWATGLITEETPTRPVHPYAITHRLAEDFVNRRRHLNQMQTLILRLSNGYGYPMDSSVDRWTLVFNDLCRQAIMNGRIALRSSGKQQRDFIALGDVARAVEFFLHQPHDSWQDGLFNLGSGRSLSILQAAELIADEFERRYGRKAGIEVGPDDAASSLSEVRYGIGKLLATGFMPRDEMSAEIQGTFEICEGLSHAS
jgi:UDP-glucose 4-epimerase